MGKIVCPLSLTDNLVSVLTGIASSEGHNNRSLIAERLIQKGLQVEKTQATPVLDEKQIEAIVRRILSVDQRPEAPIHEEKVSQITQQAASAALNSIIKNRKKRFF